MGAESMKGGNGLRGGWAVWPGATMEDGAAAPAEEAARPTAEAHPLETVGDVPARPAQEAVVPPQVVLLQAQADSLARENELLRQRLALADRQVEVKDAQINDFKAITENLTRQNQVLLMLAQGVPMERILKGGGQDIEVRPAGAGRAAAPSKMGGGSASGRGVDRGRLAGRLRALAAEGLSHRQMAEQLNREGTPPLSGGGRWDRRKVGKALASLRKG